MTMSYRSVGVVPQYNFYKPIYSVKAVTAIISNIDYLKILDS